MSLYIAELAFSAEPGFGQQTRAGVVLGSLASGLLGAGVLMATERRRRAET